MFTPHAMLYEINKEYLPDRNEVLKLSSRAYNDGDW